MAIILKRARLRDKPISQAVHSIEATAVAQFDKAVKKVVIDITKYLIE